MQRTDKSNDLVYLDNAATTQVAPEVREAMLPHLDDQFGNPATLYPLGQRSAEAVARAREQMGSLLGASADEILFTSGGTESDNWAIMGSVLGREKRHIVTSAIEHHAVLDTCKFLEKAGLGETTILPVDSDGRVNPDDLRSAIRDDTALVSIMYANNEIGTLQPIAELAAIAHERDIPFHTDAVQAVGKLPFTVDQLGVDMLSLSGHKFHGPKGVGALYLRKGVRLQRHQHGGGQERNLRAGTTNTPGVVGMGMAAELAAAQVSPEQNARLRSLTEKLWIGINNKIAKIQRNSPVEDSLPSLLNICVEAVEGEAMLLCLAMNQICVSSGSACTTGNLDPSHVLLAIGLPAEEAHGSVRFSLEHGSTEEDIESVISCFPTIVSRLRSMSPVWKG